MAEQNTNVTNTSEQQELGELLQIRRDKLKALQDEGRDPFQITKFRPMIPTRMVIVFPP